MIATIIAGVLLLIGLGILVFGKGTYEGDEYNIRKLALVPFVIVLIVMGFASTTMVQAKNVGVLTTFGKTSDRTLDPGLTFKLPWQKVTEVDGTVQRNKYYGDDCIEGKIGDGSSACLYTTIRWRINPDKANQIYADYRSDDPAEEFRQSVISSQFQEAIQAVLASFNPVANLETVSDTTSTAELKFVPDVEQMGDDLEESMRERLADDNLAEIVSVSVSGVRMSESTQDTINDFIKAVGETRIAAQGKETAREQAETNKILSESVSNNPNVLVARCLDLIAQNVFDPPPGFSCWPGAAADTVVPLQ